MTAGLLAGCALPASLSPAGSSSYRQGYHDGCDGGYAVAGSPLYVQRDSASPSGDDPEYVNGWMEGYSRCNNSWSRVQNTIHTVLSGGL